MISCHFTSILLFFSIFYLGSFQEENASPQSPKSTQRNGKGISTISLSYDDIPNICNKPDYCNLNLVCNELKYLEQFHIEKPKCPIPLLGNYHSLLQFSFSVFLIQYSYIPQFRMCNPKFNRVIPYIFSIFLVIIFDDKISYIGAKLEMEHVLHQLSVLIKEAQLVEIVHLGK